MLILCGLFYDVFCYDSYFFPTSYFRIKPLIKGEREQYTNLFETGNFPSQNVCEVGG